VEPLADPEVHPLVVTKDAYFNWQAEKAARMERDVILIELRDWYKNHSPQ
jgi:hypothetical protein